MSNVIPSVITEQADILLNALKLDAPRMLKEHEEIRKGFQSRHLEIWGAGINLLEMLTVIALEAGAEFNTEFRPKAAVENNLIFEALTRLHARACQVASEVLVLLKSGFADGAHARWRTLYEICVVSYFIKESDDQQVAKQYLLHNYIESYDAVKQYKKIKETKDLDSILGPDPFSDDEWAKLEATHTQLINQFGEPYSKGYGWAAPVIKGYITFKSLADTIGFEHWQPYYKLASHNVHAGPKGVYFRIGLDDASTNTLLAGPSNMGLVDPAHHTAISLSQITINLLMIESNIHRLVICQTMSKLVDEIGDTFVEAREQAEKL